MNTETLLTDINPVELLTWAPELDLWHRGLVDNEDEVAQFRVRGGPVSSRMSAAAPHTEDARPDKTYWAAVKTEMRLFLCTDDKRYRDLWKRIKAMEKRGTTAIVGVIAAFLGASIGAPAALIAGFVAICLYGFAKLGKEAYCRHTSQSEA